MWHTSSEVVTKKLDNIFIKQQTYCLTIFRFLYLQMVCVKMSNCICVVINSDIFYKLQFLECTINYVPNFKPSRNSTERLKNRVTQWVWTLDVPSCRDKIDHVNPTAGRCRRNSWICALQHATWNLKETHVYNLKRCFKCCRFSVFNIVPASRTIGIRLLEVIQFLNVRQVVGFLLSLEHGWFYYQWM